MASSGNLPGRECLMCGEEATHFIQTFTKYKMYCRKHYLSELKRKNWDKI